MKRKHLIALAGLGLLILSAGCGGRSPDSTVTVSGAFALYPLAVRWKEEYARFKPEVRIEVSAGGAGKGMTDVLAGLVDIAMVSREINPAETAKGAVGFPVAKDAVIPTVNSRSPVLALLRTRGLTRQECAALWITGKAKRWSELGLTGGSDSLIVYTRSDACGAGEVWAKYLGGKTQDDLGGVRVFGDPGLAEAVIRDPNGIGYNNINFAYDAATLKPVEGLEVLKLDFNGNGRIDPGEDVYAVRSNLIAAIRDGRFPSPPARDLYFVTKGLPAKKAAAAFIVWALTGGQRFIDESGYIPTREEDRTRCLAVLRAE